MSLFMEIETDRKLPFDARKIAELVIETSLDYVKCPYETEVSLLLTTDEEIKEINRMQRQIDRATDVLSFPMADYETPGDFSHLDEDAGLFHPDTGELMLGDIVISVDKVFEQAIRTFAASGICISNCAQHASFIWLRSYGRSGKKRNGDASKKDYGTCEYYKINVFRFGIIG